MSDIKRCDACQEVYEDGPGPLHVAKYRWFGIGVVREVVDLCGPCFRGLATIYNRIRTPKATP